MPEKKLIQKIKIAQKQLDIPDDQYRTMLDRMFHVDSCTKLGNDQALRLIRHFRDLGWQPKSSPKKYDDLPPRDIYDATPGQRRKIEVMWHNIYRGNSETKHLRQFLWNHFKISEIRFIRDKDLAYKIIEGLKAMANRRDHAAFSV
jgi:hypothetical protein